MNDEVVTDEADQPITGDEMSSSQNLHGAQVLSLLAGYHPDHFIGVAPDAEYILAKTELDDNMPEMPSEEDRWVAGLEWADSLGAQVVNSSLGYNRWDDGTGYSPADLDGETALTSVAAALAVRRGIVVVVSAGNEANRDWHYITMPADADGAIAVGAVDVPGSGERVPQIASFSSRGPTADGRIKPDVVAPGSGVVVADLRRGGYVRRGGTSFAAPLVSGVCALLLQKNPEWEAGPSAGGFALDCIGLGGRRSRHGLWLGADKRAGGQWPRRGAAAGGPPVGTLSQSGTGRGSAFSGAASRARPRRVERF